MVGFFYINPHGGVYRYFCYPTMHAGVTDRVTFWNSGTVTYITACPLFYIVHILPASSHFAHFLNFDVAWQQLPKWVKFVKKPAFPLYLIFIWFMFSQAIFNISFVMTAHVTKCWPLSGGMLCSVCVEVKFQQATMLCWCGNHSMPAVLHCEPSNVLPLFSSNTMLHIFSLYNCFEQMWGWTE